MSIQYFVHLGDCQSSLMNSYMDKIYDANCVAPQSPIKACTQRFLGDSNIVHTSIRLQGINLIDIWSSKFLETQHHSRKMFCLLYLGSIVFIMPCFEMQFLLH